MSESFYLLSLGCPKNEVDAEVLINDLKDRGYYYVTSPERADFLMINTCGFILDAKEEAIAAILDLADYKSDNRKKLIVLGCLSQRYANEIYEEFPEVDLALGTADYHKAHEFLEKLSAGENLRGYIPGDPGSVDHLNVNRKIAPNRRFAYLKISEGCYNFCAFCAIPQMRGTLKSRSIGDICREAEYLIANGIREIILVSQDTTRYGTDLYKKPSLPELLRALDELDGQFKIRLMYMYGEAFAEELVDVIAGSDHILHYIDMPIQHASDKILKAMRRHETKDGLAKLITRLRERVPDIILRTTVMVGFPGETDADFEELLDFIKTYQFDRLGCFIFSPEEGTPAYDMDGRPDEKVSGLRYNRLMQAQQAISAQRNNLRLNTECDVLIEGVSEDGLFYTGRSYGEAPEIDPLIYVLATSPDISVGDIARVKIVEVDDYELTGVTVQ